MSSMDTGNTLRSQEFVQRSEMQSQSLRQDSANQMVSGLSHTMEAARQYAMMKAEADARLQMHEQEMQLNAVKLQHMQAIDATDMSGYQVEAMRLQNEATKFSLEQEKKKAEAWDTSGMNDVEAEITRMYGGGQGLLKQGLRWENHKLVHIPPDELKVLLAASRSDNQRGIDLRTLLRSYEDSGDYDNAARIRAEIEGGVANLPPAKQKPPPPVPLDPKVEADLVPAMKAIGSVTKNPEEQKQIVRLAWDKRAEIAAVMNEARNKENQPTPFSEKDAFNVLIEALSNPTHPMHAQAKAYIRSLGGPDIGYIPTSGIVAPVVLRGDVSR